MYRSSLSEYPYFSNVADLIAKVIPEPVERVQSNLIALYDRYAKEWESARSQILAAVNSPVKTPPGNLDQNGGDCE